MTSLEGRNLTSLVLAQADVYENRNKLYPANPSYA